jgi:hypothetical protein
MQIAESRDHIADAAYRKAYATYFLTTSDLSSEDVSQAPRRLREYVLTIVNGGENDPDVAAGGALGLLRQFNQILQSQGRVKNRELHAA